MEEEFTTYGSAKIMVKNISQEDAAALSEELGRVEDVVLVQYDDSDAHYRDGKALFDLTFADTANSRRSEEALERVKALLADRDTVLYTEVGFSLSKLLAEQMLTVLIFVVIVVLSVLVFTSSTYAEIPVMILTFVTAAILNIGTHFMMGTISFVSNSVGIVLQLALSVDYAIIFCNRYKEEHEKLDVHDAVVRALAVSIPEISASSLTTIAGLTAMTMMKFRLGADMGLTLIKAIVCSLITVFLFMPALLMLFGRAMDKTKHRRFVPKISFVGRFAYASRFVMPFLLVALVLGGYWMVGRVQYAYSMELVPAFRQTQMERDQEEINAVFGESNAVALLVPSGDYAAEKALLEELADCPEVKSATGLATIQALEGHSIGDQVDAAAFSQIAGIDETSAKAVFAYYAAEQGEHRTVREDLSGYKASLLDLFLFLHDRVEAGDLELEDSQREMVGQLYEQLEMVRAQLTSDNYSRLILNLALPVQSEDTFRFLNQIHRMAEKYYGSGVVLTGDSVSAMGFRDSFSSDNTVVGLMSIALVMLILFFTFRSYGMPMLLILVIQGSIWLNFAVAALKGDYVFFLCYIIVGAIQMGANIDYAIVVSSRYLELRQTMEKRDAIIETMNLAFPTVITSGLMMVCSGLLVGFGVSQCIVAGMGYYVGTGTSISLLLILFALPQVLLLGDHFVTATTLHAKKTGLLGFLARNRLRFAALLLTAASLFSLYAVPVFERESGLHVSGTEERVASLRESVDELRLLWEKQEQDEKDADTLKYDFAQQLVTDQVGSAQLAEGEQQLAEGEEQYNSGLAQYQEGAAKLEEAQAEYDAGAAELADAQAKYNAGVWAYENGKAQYEAAKQELAAAQAQYDEGLAAYNEGKQAYDAGQQKLAEGQAAYDAGLAQYNQAKLVMDAIEPLYNAALALQQRVNELQQQYDEAMENEDYELALLLFPQLSAARAALESQLTGTSISDLMGQYEQARAELAAAEEQLAQGKQELDEGYAQAAEAEQQLAAAEAQLAEGKQALDEGYAQLAAAEQELAGAQWQLAEGKKALDEGYAQLEEGGAQIEEGKAELSQAQQELDAGSKELSENREKLEEGREQLAENLEALDGSLAALDTLSDERERLKQGIRLLRAENGIKALLPSSPDEEEVLNAAGQYCDSLLEQGARIKRGARLVELLSLAAAVTALVSLLWTLIAKRRKLPGALLSAVACLLAMAALIFWYSRCAALGGLLPAAVLSLAICAALFAESLAQKMRSLSA